MELAPGTLVLGRYVVERLIAEGGMGEVYEARHRELGSRVALKLLKPQALTDPDAVERFRREAQIAAGLSSPHIARVLDVGSLTGGAPVMVMELLDGRDLAQELELRGVLPPEEAIRWVLQATEAMIDAHRAGIVHRDLKPGNLFVAEQGGARTLKVLDFGISRISSPGLSRMTQTQSAFGTPLYMSPEQIRSTKLADERSDVWSMGVILYELCTGTLPFIAETPTALAVVINVESPLPMSAHRPGAISQELEELVSACLVKDPAQRVGSMDDLAARLRALLEPTRHGARSLPSAGDADRGAEPAAPGRSASHARTSAELGAFESVGAAKSSRVVAPLFVMIAALVGAAAVVVAVAWVRNRDAGPNAGGATPSNAPTEPAVPPSAVAEPRELAVTAPVVRPEVSASSQPDAPSAPSAHHTDAALEPKRAGSSAVRPRASSSAAAKPSATPSATLAPSVPTAQPRSPDTNPLHL